MIKKQIPAIILLIGICQLSLGQDKLSNVKFQWNNYFGSYIKRQKDIPPFLVAELPYNDKYTVIDGSNTLSPAYQKIENYYDSLLKNNFQSLNTYDSSPVQFFVPNINSSNASGYEFRVLKNGKDDLSPWKNINSFSNDSLPLDLFGKEFAKLGGYFTGWDNYLIVELRKKGSDSLLSVISVYWKQVIPKLLNIYLGDDLNELLNRLKEPNPLTLSENERMRWKKEYGDADLDTTTGLPRELILNSPASSVTFYLKAKIFKKEAIEYQLIKDGKIYVDWKFNELDNNMIWLNNLPPGNYTLRFRYTGQRQNITDYNFRINPAWHQTSFFKIVFGGLLAAFFGFITVLILFKRQKKRSLQLQSKKDSINLELKAIRAQLNPHFVFNALGSIQGLINSNDSQGANLYLYKFAQLMRFTLSNNEKELVSLDYEIDSLKTYLDLERLRYGFTYKIEIENNLDTSEIEIPFLMMQPLVENSIKHGIASLGEDGFLKIIFKKDCENLYLTIMDNGKGFDSTDAKEGYGLKLTFDRIDLLNRYFDGPSIKMSINSKLTKGTSIDLCFYKWFI
jgi:two-component system, LytTR family, sensor kinase